MASACLRLRRSGDAECGARFSVPRIVSQDGFDVVVAASARDADGDRSHHGGLGRWERESWT